MANYDYKEGKKRVEEILNNTPKIEKNDKLPQLDCLTFENAYESWVTGIFVDIRKSCDLFSTGDEIQISKIIRSFTSEIIEILRCDENGNPVDENLREIGIRGDCVYAIYTTPLKSDIVEVCDKSFYINTYMRMLNALLDQKRYKRINVGIGVSTDKELIIKAGRKRAEINNAVWIGNAVARASSLSCITNKNGISKIALSELTYDNVIDILEKQTANIRTFFSKSSDNGNVFYHGDLIKSGFYNWINQGMPK